MRALLRIAASMLVSAAAAGGCTEPPCRQDLGSCESTSDCAGGATCESIAWSFGEGQLCAVECETELDCPRARGLPGRCLNAATGGFLCYASCAQDVDCDDGWVCQPIRSNGALSAICMP